MGKSKNILYVSKEVPIHSAISSLSERLSLLLSALRLSGRTRRSLVQRLIQERGFLLCHGSKGKKEIVGLNYHGALFK